MAVPPSLLPSHSEKVIGAMKAERTVKEITFNPSSANPGETLYVSVPKLLEKGSSSRARSRSCSTSNSMSPAPMRTNIS